MRPKLFRIASELKADEEGMSEILRTNDSVLRVTDLYKSKMGGSPRSPTSDGAVGGATSNINTASKNTSSDSKESGTQGQGSSSVVAASDQNGATGGVSDILIDLADLNFGTTPTTGLEGVGGSGADLNSSLGLGSLLDDISALGEDAITVLGVT